MIILGHILVCAPAVRPKQTTLFILHQGRLDVVMVALRHNIYPGKMAALGLSPSYVESRGGTRIPSHPPQPLLFRGYANTIQAPIMVEIE